MAVPARAQASVHDVEPCAARRIQPLASLGKHVPSRYDSAAQRGTAAQCASHAASDATLLCCSGYTSPRLSAVSPTQEKRGSVGGEAVAVGVLRWMPPSRRVAVGVRVRVAEAEAEALRCGATQVPAVARVVEAFAQHAQAAQPPRVATTEEAQQQPPLHLSLLQSKSEAQPSPGELSTHAPLSRAHAEHLSAAAAGRQQKPPAQLPLAHSLCAAQGAPAAGALGPPLAAGGAARHAPAVAAVVDAFAQQLHAVQPGVVTAE